MHILPILVIFNNILKIKWQDYSTKPIGNRIRKNNQMNPHNKIKNKKQIRQSNL